VLTDVTSAVLSDPTNTFGVRRTDTNAVIVADSTALTNTGTGLYSYTFTEPAPGLTYEYWMEFVYGGETYRVQKFSTGTPVVAVQVGLGNLRISSARKIVRYSARSAGDPTVYPTFLVDLSFRRAANYLIREAHLCLRTDSQPTVANQTAYTVTSTTFRCERLDSAYLSGSNVVVSLGGSEPGRREADYIRGGYMGSISQPGTARLAIVDYTDLNDYLLGDPNPGQPRMIAFASDGSYSLYPIPDQVYTVNIRWSDFFTTWNPGVPLTSFVNTGGVLSAVSVIDASDNQGTSLAAAFSDSGGGAGATAAATLSNGTLASVAVGGSGGTNYTAATQLLLGGYNSADQAFNLPDDLLDEVMMLGAPSFLCFADPEKAFASPQGKAFLDFVERIKGKVGGLGVKRIIRR
jgi:hypothetical protein